MAVSFVVSLDASAASPQQALDHPPRSSPTRWIEWANVPAAPRRAPRAAV